jgi:hypothetical protein
MPPSEPPEEPELQILVNCPAELEAGVYSNMLSVWHSAYEFTLDFAVTLPARSGETEGSAEIPCKVVARVKIPPTMIFNVLQALNQNMDHYEARFGAIQRPEDREGSGGAPQ